MASFVPPIGACYFTDDVVKVEELRLALRDIVPIFRNAEPFAKLKLYDDWWEHDGLHFDRGPLDFDSLFSLIRSNQSLLDSTPSDDFVYVGIAPEDNSWYLRYRVEWDDDGSELESNLAVIFDQKWTSISRELDKFNWLSKLDSKTYYQHTIL